MNNEHNPIAQLITTIQQKWITDVTPFPNYKLIRWLINSQEAKLYEGFVRIESTSNGSLPEIFIAFFAPFNSKQTFSKEIFETWLAAFEEDKKTFDRLKADGKNFNWDYAFYKNKLSTTEIIFEKDLVEMILSFREALQMPERMITVVLIPNSVNNIKSYEQWLDSILKTNIPKGIQFCIFDYIEDRYFDTFFQKLDDGIGKTILLKLNLAEAERKLIENGDPNSPQLQLRKYILKMSDALAIKNLDKLKHWGNALIDAMAKSKIRSLMASAYIAYAGMLFYFKENDLIEKLLQKGLKIAEAGVKAGDNACSALLIQFYGFIASNYQLHKKYKLAIEWYCKKAELSNANAIPSFAIAAYRQAATLAASHEPSLRKTILTKGFLAGENLNNQEILYTDYPFLCLDYYYLLFEKKDTDNLERLNNKMLESFGEHWKEDTKERMELAKKQYAYN